MPLAESYLSNPNGFVVINRTNYTIKVYPTGTDYIEFVTPSLVYPNSSVKYIATDFALWTAIKSGPE